MKIRGVHWEKSVLAYLMEWDWTISVEGNIICVATGQNISSKCKTAQFPRSAQRTARRAGERTELTGRWKTDNLICITRSHGASSDNLIWVDGLKRAEKVWQNVAVFSCQLCIRARDCLPLGIPFFGPCLVKCCFVPSFIRLTVIVYCACKWGKLYICRSFHFVVASFKYFIWILCFGVTRPFQEFRILW